MSEPVDIWRRLIGDECAPLRAAAADCDASRVSAVAALRKHWPSELVAAALELAAARRKAHFKFPVDMAAELVGNVTGVEVATSFQAAKYKASRLGEHLDANTIVADLCCGIGADAMAMSEAGLMVHAVDRDPLRAWMTEQNAACRTTVGDVTDLDSWCHPDGARVFHLDPARRSGEAGSSRGGRRHWRYSDYEPGPDFIESLLERLPDGVIKLGPGVAAAELPSGELEFISESGRLTQAVLWTGQFMTSPRRATLISKSGDVFVLHGSPDHELPRTAPGHYLHTCDPAVERARLIAQLCDATELQCVHPELGLLTGDQECGSPWLTAFELLAQMPWRERLVRDWLRGHDGGLVEIKTRGRVVDPDALQSLLRGKGSTTYTVFVLRFDQRIEALITKRVVK